jgi:hypothetical protein
LNIDRYGAPAWYSLEVLGGGRVGIENFTHADCYCTALKTDRTMCLRSGAYYWYAQGLKCAGYSWKELKAAGCSAKCLVNAGCSVKDVKGAGYSCKELKAAGCSAKNLANAEN